MKRPLSRIHWARQVAAWQREGLRVVFTNGCFDVLHAGHVRTLAFAKTQGDVLLVGLNSDGSIRQLKGPRRPVNPLRQRAEVLEALSAVDGVVSFEELTPRRLLSLLRPDVLVKGADWRGHEIAGAEYVRRVAFAPVVRGLSSTMIVAGLE